jgi:predicted ATPase
MKTVFKNIGPISEAELELKDLTIIAGANNTGKTYLAYTLYGFLRLIQNPFFLRNRLDHLPFDLHKAVKKILDSSEALFSVEDFDKKAKQVVKQILHISADNISDIFSSLQDDFEGAEFFLYPDYSLPERLESSVRFKIGRKKECHVAASFENNLLSFNLLNCESSIPPEIMEGILISAFARLCVPKLPEPFILSSERFGISLFYKELDFTKNRLVEILQKLKDKGNRKNIDPFFLMMDQTSSRYAQPIKDNIDYTRDLEFVQRKRSPLINSKLFDNVKEMAGGHFKYREGIRFISKARKHSKFDIPLHLASSSARGLSDLYFFLKHVARKDQLLIIDEPESHLDTANQIEMARLLARCVNNGLKVLITTHSDYLIKEFNNLIMLNQDFSGKEKFLKKYSGCYGENDYLKQESIGAYISEKGSLIACEVDRFGLNMPNFDRTIDQINMIANELALSVEK